MKKILLLTMILATSALALNTPKSSKFDERITFASYNANEVFDIKCKYGYVSMIEFNSSERIVNIASGFSDGWELIDKDNFLFIKPKSYQINQEEQKMTDENGEEIEFSGSSFVQPNTTDWKTNLIVTTTKRVYVFDLNLIEGDEKLNYKVEFSYPQDKLKEDNAKKAALEKAKIELENAMTLSVETERVNVPRNWDFVMHVNKGSETIAPDFTYDDGVFTYIGFNSQKTIPSIFLWDGINGESILNSHLKKQGKYAVLTVHKTAERILLRSGDKLVGIINKSYAKNPLDDTYNTTKVNVERELVDE